MPFPHRMQRSTPIAFAAALLLIGAGCVNPVAERPTTPVDSRPASRVVTDAEACSVAVGDDDVFPVMQRFAHLRTLGGLLTADACGRARLDALYGGEEAVFIAASRIVLAAEATAADRAVLTGVGYACEDGAAPCLRFTARRTIPVAELLELSDIAPRIESEDCIECGASATKTYNDADAGISFSYPVSWGEVRAHRELPDIDTGKRLTLTFTAEDRVSLTAASADFSEGVGEGTPQYFTLQPGKHDFSTPASAAASITQPFSIVSFQPFREGIYRMTHDAAGYGTPVRTVSYLFTDRRGPVFATLMVNAKADASLLPAVEALVESIR